MKTMTQSQINQPKSQVTVYTLKLWELVILKNCQNALEEAFDFFYEHNRHVFANLDAELENPDDKNAIAVYIVSSSEYDKVGYIASELIR